MALTPAWATEQVGEGVGYPFVPEQNSIGVFRPQCFSASPLFGESHSCGEQSYGVHWDDPRLLGGILVLPGSDAVILPLDQGSESRVIGMK